jgi:SAM-dependent methyltransferase
MSQDKIFAEFEGNAWFRRNRTALLRPNRLDLVADVVAELARNEKLTSICEVGCANGWRLARLRDLLGRECRLAGLDPSQDAIQDGRSRYPELELAEGLLTHLPFVEQFDLVIASFVLHWVDRASLLCSLAEIDRVVRDDGYLLISDFLPDFPQRRVYHHYDSLFTYKQDYARAFESMGIYRELTRYTFAHDAPSHDIQFVGSNSRAVCSLLKKSLNGFYPETK